MRFAFSVGIFWVCMIVSGGIITSVFPGFDDKSNGNFLEDSGMSTTGTDDGAGAIDFAYNTVYSENKSLTATGPGWFVGTTGTFFNSILDLVTSNLMSFAHDFVEKWVFGIPNILGKIFQ